jgi:hypothetical protein
MNYTIGKIDKVITAITIPGCIKSLIEKDKLEEIIKECREEKEKIRLSIMEEVFNAGDEQTLHLLIDKYQAVFIRLMDVLHVHQMANKKTNDYSSLLKILNHLLNELLNFLQIHYTKYTNNFQKAPFVIIEQFKKLFSAKISPLTARINRKMENEKLIKLIIEPLQIFIASDKLTYGEIYYMEIAINKLLEFEIVEPEKDCILAIKKQLISLNYNSPLLVTYFIKELEEIIIGEESVQGKLRILKYQLKEINQINEEPGIVLYAGYTSFKLQLLNWLNEEILFYTNEQVLISGLPAIISDDTKIHSSLSVAKLALIIRLLVIDKIIINRTIAPMLRVIARIFTSLQQENISFGSLETKYHSPDKATINAVRDMLFKWINILGKL